MSLNRKAISGHGIVARGKGEPGDDDGDDDKPNHKTSSLPDIMVNGTSQRGI